MELIMSEENFVAKDFVYGGLRVSNKERFVAIIQIKEDGTISTNEQLYPYKRNRDRVVGGVYRGATFSDSKVRGLDDVSFVSVWKNGEDKMRLEALDYEANHIYKRLSLEKNADKMTEIEKIMLPIRQQYTAMIKRGDFHGASAFKFAVTEAITKPVKTS